MKAVPSCPASFLNVDLELESDEDLAPIKEHLSGSTFALSCGEENERYYLELEPLIEGRLNSDPIKCLDHLLRLIERFPPEIANLWRGCHHRIFDIGFDGGYETAPYKCDLGADFINRIAKVNGSVRITIYPFRTDDPIEEDDEEGDEREA